MTTDHCVKGYGGNIMLNRAMGTNTHLDIDYRVFTPQEKDIFIFTTDGVHEMVPASRMKDIVDLNENNLNQAASDIVTLALNLGSLDNVTCQIVRIDEMEPLSSNDNLMSGESLPFPPALSAGQILDGYKIIRELHANNRSQVYLAKDLLSEKYVALKTPSVNFEDDSRYIELFQREEWVGLQINNPHVLKYIPPRPARQFLYIVTEYIDGQSLRQWMNDHANPDMAKVRDIVAQVIRGLRVFHRLDMLHQDLKPENIMIDAAGTVKIIDLGSVHVASLEEGRKSEKLPAGAVDYTAPEYILYGGGDRLSDIYALGVVIYEMLTHRLPYGKGFSSVQTIRRQTYIPARTINADILPWLEPVLEKAVRKEPKERYQQLSELEYDLRNPKKTASSAMPLLVKNPVLFWQTLCLVLAAVIILQLVLA